MDQSEQQLYVYDEVFPALPESNNTTPMSDLGKWSNKMRIGSSVITQVGNGIDVDEGNETLWITGGL